MKRGIKILLFLAAIAWFSNIELQAERLVILTTNDTHSQIDADYADRGGILRRKALIDSVRQAEKYVMLLDAGDAVQGTVYFNLFKGEVEFAMLDSLGYDAYIVGNHEFDNGMQPLKRFFGTMHTPRLNANYNLAGTPLEGLFKPYIIKEYGGKRIGVVGINLLPEGMISPVNSVGVEYSNAAEIAELTAAFLKRVEHVDYVVVLSHVGYDGGVEANPTDDMIVSHSRNIDLVIGGHSHTVINPAAQKSVPWLLKNAEGREVAVTQTGSSGKNVGYIALDLDSLRIADYRLMPVDRRYDNRTDYPQLRAYLAPFKAKVDSLMNHPVAHCACDVGRSSAMMWNFVADAAFDIISDISSLKIDMTIMNAGGIRQSFTKGIVSEGLVNSMFPFDNKMVVLKMSGRQLLNALAVMGGRGGDLVSRQAYVEYTPVSDSKMARILKATVGGKTIDAYATYTVATLDYLANGGDYMVPMTTCERIFVDTMKFGNRMLLYLKEMERKGRKVNPAKKQRMVRK